MSCFFRTWQNLNSSTYFFHSAQFLLPSEFQVTSMVFIVPSLMSKYSLWCHYFNFFSLNLRNINKWLLLWEISYCCSNHRERCRNVCRHLHLSNIAFILDCLAWLFVRQEPFYLAFCVLGLVCLLCATEPISTSSSHVRYSPDFVCLRA